MTFLKKLLKALGILAMLLILFILVVLLIDRQSTNYLKVSKLDQEGDSYLITHVNLIPMTRDTILINKSVLIEKGRIVKIDDDIESAGTSVIDGENRYLIPGLSDMHVHVWDNYELGLYLSNGVTSVRNLWGQPFHIRMKKEIEEDEILSPMFFTSGPKLTGPEYIGEDNYQLFSEEEAREMVHFTKDEGYDFIKTYYGLPETYFDAILEEAQKEGLDIVAHPTQNVRYQYHFNPQIKSIEHAEDIVQQPLKYVLDTLKLNEVVAQYGKATQTSFCPTLTVYHNIHTLLTDENIMSSPSLNAMNPLIKKVDSQAQFDRWSNTKREDSTITDRISKQHDFHLLAVKKLHDAGVTIICGTDAGIGITPAGASIHEELGFYSQAGLSNFEVLETATVNPSKTHDFMKDLGTIETGKWANLVLLKENPLENLKALEKPEIVFIKGRLLDKPTLDRFKDKALERNNLFASLFRYAEFLLKK